MPVAISTCLLVIALCSAVLGEALFAGLAGGLALLIEAVVFYLAGQMGGPR